MSEDTAAWEMFAWRLVPGWRLGGCLEMSDHVCSINIWGIMGVGEVWDGSLFVYALGVLKLRLRGEWLG